MNSNSHKKLLALRGLRATMTALLALLMVAATTGTSASAGFRDCGDESCHDTTLGKKRVRGFGEMKDADWAEVLGLPEDDLEWTYQTDDAQLLEGDSGLELRQRFIPNASSNKTGTDLVQAVFELPAAKGYRLSQEVFLEDGWVFGPEEEHNQIGKLGLGVLGGSHASGGSSRTDGFSSRFMWYRGNEVSAYAYHADRAERFPYGDQMTGGSLETGRWQQLDMEVVANSSKHKSDGELRVWVDGELTVDRDDIRWQDSGRPMIDRVTYASFYGGTGKEYAPPTTTYARFRNFMVEAL